ncbi:MAG: hypothetical protein WAM89_01640 [Terriglobales bacterium]
MSGLELSARRQNPFHLRIGDNAVGENFCRGTLEVEGQVVSWNLRYQSSFRFTLSNKGWIGFSRTPHSDAVFSGQITLNGERFEGSPLGFGVQGHNCGYQHRNFWTWAHSYFPRIDRGSKESTLEALVYEMPFGLVFRKAMLWHEGEAHEFGTLQESGRDRNALIWSFHGSSKDGLRLEATIDGAGQNVHRLPYLKTDCSGSFEVANNSLAKAVVRLERRGRLVGMLETDAGAVLEMVGE